MTPPHLLHRSSGSLARSALVALALAGSATAAVAAQDGAGRTTTTPRVAVLAGSDATAADIASATQDQDVLVRRAGGTFEAQAQATRLAAEGYDTVIGVGAQARAAVSQAAAGEVGAGTHWQPASH
jgi:hypothetical protein